MITFNELYQKLISDQYDSDINVIAYDKYNDHYLIETDQKQVYIDQQLTHFTSINEAKNYLKSLNGLLDLKDSISEQNYKNIPDYKVIDVIKKYSKTPINNTLLEAYNARVLSKEFTNNKIVNELRSMTNVHLSSGIKDFYLKDGSHVAIHENTFAKLEELFEYPEIIEYMVENKEQFTDVIRQLMTEG
jgi:uncharacterized membrane protein YgaE (UPF0421/DUF939 family)